jgi:hypothetical protein
MSLARRHHIQQPGIIRTGPLAGLHKRPVTDRTRALTFEQARELANAVAFASSIGRPPNALLTITWRKSALFTEDEWSQLQTAVLGQVTRYLKRRGIVTAFAWTRERAPGFGPHTHVMIYLGPRSTRVRQELKDYLRKTFQLDAGGINISTGQYGAHRDSMRAGMLKYILKGIDHTQFRYVGYEAEKIAAALGIRCTVKRAGTSQNIAQAARKAAGWRERRDLASLARMLNPTHDEVTPMRPAA